MGFRPLPALPEQSSPAKLVSLLLEKELIEIRAVNLAVAKRACLEKCVLIMEAGRPWRSAETRLRVALQAEHVYVADLQHMRIGTTVRNVARLASLDLYGFMLEHVRTLFVRMALKAHKILGGRGSHLFWFHRSVHVVAVAALNQAFIYPVVKRHLELGFLSQMAGEAKFRLGFCKQKVRFFAVMGRVAGDATHAVLGMLRIDCVHVLRAAGVAGQATVVDFLCRGFLEGEYLGDVTTARNVSRTGPVAIFAAVLCDSAFLIRLLPMRAFFPAIVKVRVASLAGVRPHVCRLAGIWRSRRDRCRSLRLILGGRSLLCPRGNRLEKSHTNGANYQPSQSLRGHHAPIHFTRTHPSRQS